MSEKGIRVWGHK